MRNRDRLHSILGFTAGVLLGVVALDLISEIVALINSSSKTPMIALIDGIGIGLAFQDSTKVGAAIALVVIGHDCSDGLNTVAHMLFAKLSVPPQGHDRHLVSRSRQPSPVAFAEAVAERLRQCTVLLGS